MKKIIANLIVLSFFFLSNAQKPAVHTTVKKEKVPQAVEQAFKQKFPNVKSVKWGKEGANEWEGEFKSNGTDLSANFNPDGTWVETETEIKISDLPKAVASAMKKDYPGWTIVEANRTETSKFGTIYESDIKKGKVKKEAAYKEDGTAVKE